METPIFRVIAGKLGAIENCRKSGNTEWEARHLADIDDIMRSTAPSGAGIDAGTKIDFARSTPNCLIFTASFHHMNDSGYYDGWTEHTITIRPSLIFAIDIRISGRNRNDIKEYLSEVFSQWLETPVVQ